MLQIKRNPQTGYMVLCVNDSPMIGLDAVDKRVLIADLCRNEPEMVREVMCGGCSALEMLFKKANQRQMDVETEEGAIIEVIEKGEVIARIDELRHREQQS